MPAHHSKSCKSSTRLAQRAIIHQLLRDDHHEGWTTKQLQHILSDITPAAMQDAIIRLEANNVIYCMDDFIAASRCTRYLFVLDLIGI